MAEDRRYGPPLPKAHESWMFDDGDCDFSKLSGAKKSRRQEITSKPKSVDDYSAAGLHVIKKPQKRLFMDKSESKTIESDKLMQLKKKLRTDRDKSDCKIYEKRSSHFIKPGRLSSTSDAIEKTSNNKSEIRPKLQKSDRSSECNHSRQNDSGETKPLGEIKQKKSVEVKPNDDELNKISAKILRAEIAGDTKKVSKLKGKMEALKKELASQTSSSNEKTIILTTSDLKGNVRPVSIKDPKLAQTVKKSAKSSHDSSGSRINYFADDSKKDISTLLNEERSVDKIGNDQLIMKYAGKLSKMASNRQNWTIDDMFESNIAKQSSSSDKNSQRVIAQNKAQHKQLESCKMCLDNCSDSLIVHIGEHLYIRVPPYKSLTKYHFQIVPIPHIISTVNSDEEFQEELKNIKVQLVDGFYAKDLDLIFLETALRLQNMKHIFIDCVPLPKDDATLLPAYFKKAILDCDLEWAQNKKLIDTRQKRLFKCVPKGLPYFSVEFGKDGGFAHVIEEERLFKSYFGLEIIGNVLNSDINHWRHPETASRDEIMFKKQMLKKLKIFPADKS